MFQCKILAFFLLLYCFRGTALLSEHYGEMGATRNINLFDYILIHETLFLSDDEKKFNFIKFSDSYGERVKQGLFIHKKGLVELRASNYKELAKNTKKIFRDYKEFDKFPYNLVVKILDKMG